MKETKVTTDQNVSDVLVLFPASKNFDTVENLKSPIPNLKQEVEKKLDLTQSKCLQSNANALNLKQVCDSLEVRLEVLEDISCRLKFYLDDLEAELNRN